MSLPIYGYIHLRMFLIVISTSSSCCSVGPVFEIDFLFQISSCGSSDLIEQHSVSSFMGSCRLVLELCNCIVNYLRLQYLYVSGKNEWNLSTKLTNCVFGSALYVSNILELLRGYLSVALRSYVSILRRSLFTKSLTAQILIPVPGQKVIKSGMNRAG